MESAKEGKKVSTLEKLRKAKADLAIKNTTTNAEIKESLVNRQNYSRKKGYYVHHY